MDTDIIVLPILFVSFFGAIVLVLKTLSDNRTKRKLAEAGMTEGSLRALFPSARQRPEVFAALKWGLVLAGIGLAFILIQVFGLDERDTISYGLVFLLAAAGLLAYYRIARPIFEAHDRREAVHPAAPPPVEEVM